MALGRLFQLIKAEMQPVVSRWRCPFCGADGDSDIVGVGEPVTINNRTLKQPCECQKCGALFSAYWREREWQYWMALQRRPRTTRRQVTTIPTPDGAA